MEIKKAKKNIYAIVIVITIVILSLLCSVALGYGNFKNQALALSSSSVVDELLNLNASGNLDDVSESKYFNGENVKSLFAKITGNSSQNTISSVESFLKSSDSTGYNSGSAATSVAQKNITVKLAGMEWNVMYLSQVDKTSASSAKKGDIIATLWLSNISGTSNSQEWASYAANASGSGWYSGSTTANAYPGNMYGTSYMRALINNGGAYLNNGTTSANYNFTPSAGGALVNFTVLNESTYKYNLITSKLLAYLATPANFGWQETENNYVIRGHNDAHTLTNEAWGTPEGTVAYYSNLNYTTKEGTGSYYTRWKDDYLWLPSIAEVGNTTAVAGSGLWKATVDQKKNSPTSGAVRLRTAAPATNATYTFALNSSSGAGEYTSPEGTDDKNFVRPAIHLNLTEVAGLRAEDYSTPYNGSDRTVADAPFYDSFAFSSSNMKIEYFDSTGTQYVTPKYVGKYRIKFTLLNTTDLAWSSGDETDPVRWVNYEITPKEVRVDFVTHPNDPPDASLNVDDLCGDDKNNTDSLLVITYESTDGGGYLGTTPPQKRGIYSATVSISDSNYTTDKTYTTTYEKLATRLELPTFNKTTVIYNGNNQS
ncbi:MAG: hypothetical protein K2N53_06105, partial [Clostridia bacterium]|nr:hypothetical protein [Clostridia bacterium]